MNIRLVRHATLVIQLDGRTLLIDPMLEKGVGEFRSFLIEKPEPPCNTNPIVPLPARPDLSSILYPVHIVFVTHTHKDHFDDAAVQELLPYKDDLHIFCQPEDKEKLSKFGFPSVQPVEDNLQYDGIEVFRTDGKHGPNNELGPVSGFVLRSQNEPTLYIAGDTIWCPEVAVALDNYKPEIVVVNAGAAQMYAKPPAITMTKKHVAKVCEHIPSATVIAVHMEAIDHCLLRRKELEDFIESEGLSGQVRIPADGESMQFRSLQPSVDAP